MAKRIIDYYNLFVGAFVTIAAAILGEHWYLFAAFLALNVVDWLTGWYKANKQGVESSKVGLKGALKKLGYWAVVAVAFELAGCLQALCVDMLGLQLDWLLLLGWWVLASKTDRGKEPCRQPHRHRKGGLNHGSKERKRPDPGGSGRAHGR